MIKSSSTADVMRIFLEFLLLFIPDLNWSLNPDRHTMTCPLFMGVHRIHTRLSPAVLSDIVSHSLDAAPVSTDFKIHAIHPSPPSCFSYINCPIMSSATTNCPSLPLYTHIQSLLSVRHIPTLNDIIP